MRFSSQFLDQFRKHITLSDYIRRTIKLERKGKEYLGLCPFHHEKTPSFSVNDDKQFYHCFGCGAHGDVIKFVSLTRGLGYTESVTELAHEFGISLPEEDFAAKKNEDKTKSLYEVMSLAAEFYSHQLRLVKNRPIIEYLQRRQFTQEHIKKFAIGYAPDARDALKSFLLSKGVSENLILQAGLLSQNDRKETYDKFRHRIIFPIFSSKNNIIAFGGRTAGTIQPKYLNSPETAIFKKGEVLYCENIATPLARKNNKIIVVEGYIDAIALQMAGFEETVATLGTALTTNHLLNLWKLAHEPTICLDGDEAGRRAMFKIAENAVSMLKPGYSLKFAVLPDQHDPDDFIKKHGKEAFGQIIDNSIPLSEVLWQNAISVLPPKATPEQHAALEKTLDDITAKISDNKVKIYYKNYFSQQLWHYVKRRQLSRTKYSSLHSTSALVRSSNDLGAIDRYEQTLVAIIINNPAILEDYNIAEEFIAIELGDRLDKLRTTILEANAKLEEIDADQLKLYLEKYSFIDDIEYLCNDELNLMTGNRELEKAKALWNYSINKYYTLILEKEYKDALSDMTENSLMKAYILKQDIIKLQQDIHKLGLHFGNEQ
jgi:DNA primase